MSRFRVLFLAANPGTTSRLAIDEEMHTIQQRLRTSCAAERVELCAEWALRAEELPAALIRHKPHVVHFSGHGSVAGELLFISNQSPNVPAPISPDTLRRIFQSLAGSVQCVVLNACYSSIQAQSLSDVLPCVIGMTRAVEDNAAIAFAAGFYEALTLGQDIKSAFELGRAQIELAQCVDQRNIPVLIFRRDIDGERLYVFQNDAEGFPKTNIRNASLEYQLQIHQKNLSKLMIKKAKYGPLDVPLSVENQIEDIQQEIKSLELKLLSNRSDPR